MENLNVNQEMNFEEMADVVGGTTVSQSCYDLMEFVSDLRRVNAPGVMIRDAEKWTRYACSSSQNPD
ncbi:MAG: hypothetical protein ACJAWV_003247 [Flammeovirgaceae bacterium]|jgi:hypothetical protein